MSKKGDRRCGTCRFLRPRSDGKPFHYAHSYKCEWKPPEIVWPDSVAEGAYDDPRVRLRAPGTYMQPKDGKNCPCWEAKPETPVAGSDGCEPSAASHDK